MGPPVRIVVEMTGFLVQERSRAEHGLCSLTQGNPPCPSTIARFAAKRSMSWECYRSFRLPTPGVRSLRELGAKECDGIARLEIALGFGEGAPEGAAQARALVEALGRDVTLLGVDCCSLDQERERENGT